VGSPGAGGASPPPRPSHVTTWRPLSPPGSPNVWTEPVRSPKHPEDTKGPSRSLAGHRGSQTCPEDLPAGQWAEVRPIHVPPRARRHSSTPESPRRPPSSRRATYHGARNPHMRRPVSPPSLPPLRPWPDFVTEARPGSTRRSLRRGPDDRDEDIVAGRTTNFVEDGRPGEVVRPSGASRRPADTRAGHTDRGGRAFLSFLAL